MAGTRVHGPFSSAAPSPNHLVHRCVIRLLRHWELLPCRSSLRARNLLELCQIERALQSRIRVAAQTSYRPATIPYSKGANAYRAGGGSSRPPPIMFSSSDPQFTFGRFAAGGPLLARCCPTSHRPEGLQRAQSSRSSCPAPRTATGRTESLPLLVTSGRFGSIWGAKLSRRLQQPGMPFR
ncbi:hypothetical protein ABIA25_005674 [Sinorhizobium fredii]